MVLSSINILLVQSYHLAEATEDATVLLLPPPAWLVEASRGPYQRASMGVGAMHAKERSVASPSLKSAERAATVLAGVKHRALYNALPRLELDQPSLVPMNTAHKQPCPLCLPLPFSPLLSYGRARCL